MNQLLGNILFDLYQFSAGLNKHHFQWTRAPTGLEVLAGTDTTGLVKWQGKRYYVCYEWQTNAIVIEND